MRLNNGSLFHLELGKNLFDMTEAALRDFEILFERLGFEERLRGILEELRKREVTLDCCDVTCCTRLVDLDDAEEFFPPGKNLKKS